MVAKRRWFVRVTLLTLLALGLTLLPGTAGVFAAGGTQVLKFALIVPRTPELAMEEKKYEQAAGRADQ